MMKRWGATKWIFQMEKGSTTGRRHFQGSVKLAAKKRKTWLLNNSPVGKVGLSLSPTVNETGAFKYCMKAETRTAGPWCDHVLYLQKDLQMMKNPLPWQQWVLDVIATEPDDRTIHWLWEPEGKVGKSKLVKYLDANDMAITIAFGTATQCKTGIVAEGPARAYLIDLPRTIGNEEKVEAMFSTMEAVKNGFVKSYMYGKVNKLLMEPPHVFVYANHAPDTRLLSKDRWVVKKIGTNRDFV